VIEATFINDEVSRDLDEAIAFAGAEGIGAIELRMVGATNVVQLPWHELEEIRRKLDAAGLRVAALSTPLFKCPLDGAPSADDPDPFKAASQDFDDHLALIARASAVAAFLGTQRLRCFAFLGHGAYADVRDDILERLQRAGAALTAADPLARFCIENEHTTYVRTAAEVASLVRDLGEPFEVLWDPGNAHVAGERGHLVGFADVAGLVTHIHAKDPGRGGRHHPLRPVGPGRHRLSGAGGGLGRARLRRLREPGAAHHGRAQLAGRRAGLPRLPAAAAGRGQRGRARRRGRDRGGGGRGGRRRWPTRPGATPRRATRTGGTTAHEGHAALRADRRGQHRPHPCRRPASQATARAWSRSPAGPRAERMAPRRGRPLPPRPDALCGDREVDAVILCTPSGIRRDYTCWPPPTAASTSWSRSRSRSTVERAHEMMSRLRAGRRGVRGRVPVALQAAPAGGPRGGRARRALGTPVMASMAVKWHRRALLLRGATSGAAPGRSTAAGR
jgi:sugar phosphate isomerase/epimerase